MSVGRGGGAKYCFRGRNSHEYHSFQNYYTHKIIVFKLFRSLQLQFSGPTGINFRYSYSFVGLTGIFLYSYSLVQLYLKMVRGIISENYNYSYIKNGFRIKSVMILKRMVNVSLARQHQMNINNLGRTVFGTTISCPQDTWGPSLGQSEIVPETNHLFSVDCTW